VLADTTIEDVAAIVEKLDMIVLPGGLPGADNLRENAIVREFIMRADRAGAYIAAICAAPRILGELGLVEGVYELKDNGICKMSYLPSEADIRVGDVILSSGVGSFYPRGLVIGSVIGLVPDEYSRTLEAQIQPASDLSDLRSVMIIKSFNAYTVPEEAGTDE
jgi:putative intracellular protease/amidase